MSKKKNKYMSKKNKIKVSWYVAVFSLLAAADQTVNCINPKSLKLRKAVTKALKESLKECQLTDISKPSDGNRAARKAIDRGHLALAHPDAKTIKLADLISNKAHMKNITKKDLTWKFLAKEWPSGYCEYHGDDDFYLESVIDDMIPAPLRPVTNKLRAELRAKYAKVNEGYDDNFLRDLKKSVLYTRTRAAGRGGRDGGILGLFTKKGRLIGHIETGVDGHYQNAGIVAEITNAT